MYYVEDRKSTTLTPLILNNIPPGSTIMSDKFSSYVNIHRNESKLEPYGFTHYWVNHSREFVDSFQSFINTQIIERTWRSLRNSISSIKRTFTPSIIQQYLDTFVLRSRLTQKELFEFIIHAFSLNPKV